MVNVTEMPAHVMEYLGAATFNAVLAHMAASAKSSETERKDEKEESV